MTILLTIALSFVILVIAILAMSVGVMAGRPAIKGSCGGVGSAGCELCGNDVERCRPQRSRRPADTR